jgi:hypothetical protein
MIDQGNAAMRRSFSPFTDCFLHPRFRYLRLILFSVIASSIFLIMWSISGHPVTNKHVLSDTEVDRIFRECQSGQVELPDPHLGVFILFEQSQIEIMQQKIELWSEKEFCPCDALNESNRGPETESTDIIFFFLGDGQEHPQLYQTILSSLSATNSETDIHTVLPCFSAVLFKSLRDLQLPADASLTDTFYQLMSSPLLRKYTHIIWMDISVAVIRPLWLPALYKTLTYEPFWVLGAMILSERRDHFDRSHYHIHMNAIYRVGNLCFSQFLSRVRAEFVDTRPDLAMHLYRTDYANFREAQHTQHLFRYSRLFLSLDVPVTIRPNVPPGDWPGTYFLIQDRNWAFQSRPSPLGKAKTTGRQTVRKTETATASETEPRPQIADDVVEEEGQK